MILAWRDTPAVLARLAEISVIPPIDADGELRGQAVIVFWDPDATSDAENVVGRARYRDAQNNAYRVNAHLLAPEQALWLESYCADLPAGSVILSETLPPGWTAEGEEP